jgi:diphthamide synthase (EF-2-diphthine--ammonia ligase)
VEPIWGEPSIEVAWEVVERGYQAVVVSVDLSLGAATFLGREFDADLVTDLGCTEGLDAGGEHGEYHTFVYDGPAFDIPVPFSLGDTVEIEGHRFVDLMPNAYH